MRGQKFLWAKKYEEFALNRKTNDQIMAMFGTSFINDECIFQ